MKTDVKEVFEKTAQAETLFVILQIVNSLVNFHDKLPTSSKDKSDKYKKVSKEKQKEHSKSKARNQIVAMSKLIVSDDFNMNLNLNLLERLTYTEKELGVTTTLANWL